MDKQSVGNQTQTNQINQDQISANSHDSAVVKSQSKLSVKKTPTILAPVTESRYLPLVSVIIPVYNVAKILERCVDSVRAQVYPNLEIILVDDGSTDMSGAFCDVFAKKDKRVKVIHQANQGLSAARNAGLKIATGKWITFVDSDDTIRPEMIDILHKMCYTERVKMSICGFYEVKADGEGTINQKQTPTEKILDTQECLRAMLCEDGFTMSAWGKLYAKELFDLVTFPDHRLYEDVGTTYKLVLQCEQIAVSSFKGYNYYQNDNSITKQAFNLHKMDLIDLTDQMCDEITKWGKDKSPAIQTMLSNLTKKRRMHARFSILRQIVMVEEGKNTSVDARSLQNAEQSTVKYLRKHKDDILKNPLASRRDKIAMRALQCGVPVFKWAWQKYSNKSQSRH